MQSRERNQNFDPMLFEDTVASKIMEDFNTKCYVINKENKSKEIPR